MGCPGRARRSVHDNWRGMGHLGIPARASDQSLCEVSRSAPSKGGELRVAATCNGAQLTLSVFNDGPLLAEHVKESVGLSNTRQRLQALYGNAQALTLQNQGAAGVLAIITLPFR